ncbi:hypothetical protein AB54_4015 [Escherichia coli 2-011-08_S1_C3]|nr:hypothetical protein AB54_4015 [Escherichia coli 2-011-08_S1_C3]
MYEVLSFTLTSTDAPVINKDCSVSWPIDFYHNLPVYIYDTS